MSANVARGEVEIEIAGETYVLAATFENWGKLQGKLKVKGYTAVMDRLSLLDSDDWIDVVRALAIEGDAEKLKKAPLRTLIPLREAVHQAINGPEEEQEKNGQGAGTTDQT